MRIYTKAGDLSFKRWTFPDGQPHFELATLDDGGFQDVTIETAIRNPHELFEVLLAKNVLSNFHRSVSLDVRYLMGARMDRAISPEQPFTLQVVASLINGAGFARVRLLDVHSDADTRLIRNSTNLLPYAAVNSVIRTIAGVDGIINLRVIRPDVGAEERTVRLAGSYPVERCIKKRDAATGALSGFSLVDHYNPDQLPWNALIVDDICDGGGTFVGIAKILREAGARHVYLYVTHSIFSKQLPLPGVAHIFTTDSYYSVGSSLEGVTIMPVSMKEMKEIVV